jgi:hypothetical protein
LLVGEGDFPVVGVRKTLPKTLWRLIGVMRIKKVYPSKKGVLGPLLGFILEPSKGIGTNFIGSPLSDQLTTAFLTPQLLVVQVKTPLQPKTGRENGSSNKSPRPVTFSLKNFG